MSKKREKPEADKGAGTMSRSLSSLLTAPDKNDRPLQLDIALIDEDPNQPRTENNPGFSVQSLAELAESIRQRNVKTPVSVREDAERTGRYIINHGARRFRASKLAGKKTIPAYIDNDYTETDQIIENVQRNELTAREIAEYIGREIARGIKKSQIAKNISKSPAFVTQHATLLDLPDSIADAFSSGRTRDITVVNELVTAHKKHPVDVDGWLRDPAQDITRASVRMLRDYLDERSALEPAATAIPTKGESRTEQETKPSSQSGKKRLIVVVEYDEEIWHINLTKRPQEGYVWLFQGFKEAEALLEKVRLFEVREP